MRLQNLAYTVGVIDATRKGGIGVIVDADKES